MEKITKEVFKANDGKEFDTEQECLDYENSLEFRKWYSKNNLTTTYSDYVDDLILIEWLQENKSQVLKLYGNESSQIKNIVKELDKIIKSANDDKDDYSFSDLLDSIQELKEKLEGKTK